MSTSIRIAAQRVLTQEDIELVYVFNKLCDVGMEAPDKLVNRLSAVLEEKVYQLEPITVDNKLIETYVEGDGSVMHGDGTIIRIANLPTGTTALRIYAT